MAPDSFAIYLFEIFMGAQINGSNLIDISVIKKEECDKVDGAFWCSDGVGSLGRCLPEVLRCNLRQECINGEDEQDCSKLSHDPLEGLIGSILLGLVWVSR